MAILTPLSLDDARAVGRLYGLDVAAVRAVRAGSVNSNFEVQTSTGHFFLRIYEEQTPATATREASLLSHLARGGVATPEPLHRIDGQGFIAVQAGKPVAVFPYCEGEMACQKSVTAERTRRVGKALRGIHRIGSSLERAELEALAGESRFGREALLSRLPQIRELTSRKEIIETCASLEIFLLEARAEPQVMGLIHGDVFRDNVLWRADTIAAVLDFESASVGSIAFDLMVTVLAWCFGDDLDQSLARSLMAGYGHDAPIDRALRAELYDAGRFACARFTTTRLTDFELRPREATVYKDFRRWWQRMKRIEMLGPRGLADALGIDPIGG